MFDVMLPVFENSRRYFCQVSVTYWAPCQAQLLRMRGQVLNAFPGLGTKELEYWWDKMAA